MSRDFSTSSSEGLPDTSSPDGKPSGQGRFAGESRGGLSALPSLCFLAFRGGCYGTVTRGGHCEYHLRVERARAVLRSDPYDPWFVGGSAEQMMIANRPPLGISKGGGYRKPKYVWNTPKQALRRPSQGRYKLQRAYLGVASAADTEGLTRFDFLAVSGAGRWLVRKAGATGRPMGRPTSGVTDVELLKGRIEEAALGNGHADLSDANSKQLAELFGCSRRTIQRLRAVSPKCPKSKGKNMETTAPTISERITRAELELERQKTITAEVARQVGLTFDDAGVTEAVEKFLKDLES